MPEVNEVPAAPREIRRLLAEEAAALGVPFLGFASPRPLPDMTAYDAALASGRLAGMSWMARHRALKADPCLLLPDLRGILVLGLPYRPERLPEAPAPGWGRVSSHAWNEDYHVVHRQRIEGLVEALDARFPHARHRACVDSAPVWERHWAWRAGLGDLGRNALLIPHGGSPLTFLAVVLTSLDPASDLEPREPPVPGASCGSCRRCLDACPTGALLDHGEVDARRCVSYLTIEERGPIPEELRPLIGDRIFGCDACQLACPHALAGPPGDPAFSPGRPSLDAARLLVETEKSLKSEFQGSPISRAVPERLQRNAAVVLGNALRAKSVGLDARRALSWALRNPSPLVREHAAWALAWART